MDRIKIMSEDLSNKIAAGEVVERIANVIKELTENSIDAQSTEIAVSLENAGSKEIKVMDNGIGMDPNDALNAFKRHATSKIYKPEDLFFINTLGFRGEALPSIASVSKVTLETSEGDVGTKIVIEGGKLIENTKCAARKGTTIKVKDLFYNTPARLKYLKSEQTELSNTTQYMEKLALSYPEIAFTLTNNDTTIIKTTGSGKSTLVNNLIKETNSKLNEVVTSYRTNTTKDFIRLELTNKLLVIDSPGFASISLRENNKDTFKYAIKPRTYQMRKSETLNIIDERYINFETETSATLYIPNNVKSHKDYKQKAFSYDIHVPANSDLIIIGTGFMNIIFI